MQIQQDDKLNEAVGQDGVEGYADQIPILLPPVRDIAAECEELEDHVEYRDDGSGDEQIRIGFRQHSLHLVHLSSGPLLLSGLLKALSHRRENGELHARQRVVIDMKREGHGGLVDRIKVLAENPEVIGEHGRIILFDCAVFGGSQAVVRCDLGR